jgi:hypothetical protein
MDVLHGLPKGSLKGSKTSQQSGDIVVGQIFIKLQFTKQHGFMLALLLSCSIQLVRWAIKLGRLMSPCKQDDKDGHNLFIY